MSRCEYRWAGGLITKALLRYAVAPKKKVRLQEKKELEVSLTAAERYGMPIHKESGQNTTFRVVTTR
jgi:hypothetical protein